MTLDFQDAAPHDIGAIVTGGLTGALGHTVGGLSQIFFELGAAMGDGNLDGLAFDYRSIVDALLRLSRLETSCEAAGLDFETTAKDATVTRFTGLAGVELAGYELTVLNFCIDRVFAMYRDFMDGEEDHRQSVREVAEARINAKIRAHDPLLDGGADYEYAEKFCTTLAVTNLRREVDELRERTRMMMRAKQRAI